MKSFVFMWDSMIAVPFVSHYYYIYKYALKEKIKTYTYMCIYKDLYIHSDLTNKLYAYFWSEFKICVIKYYLTIYQFDLNKLDPENYLQLTAIKTD